MRFARLSLIAAVLILQSACQLIGAVPRSTQTGSKKSVRITTLLRAPDTGPAYETYLVEVRKHWTNNDYNWLESEAKRLRESKERLPGGYWKLRVLYRTIENIVHDKDRDEAWKLHIARVENWSTQHPTSVMPRIILADVWSSYAWKARGTDYANKVKPENWPIFYERLKRTNGILAEASRLEEKCPEWYVTALEAALGQDGDREVFEKLFEQGVALEPNYYYLYQAKGTYLLPRWYGEPGEWEQFAEAAANTVDGEERNIILFAIYSNMLSISGLEFMDTHRTIAPRLMAGFRAIEKLYGLSPQRLNEACLISFFAGDNKIPAELMKRIGDDYDVTVWKDESNFNIYRQEALMRSGELPRYGRSTGGQKE